MEDGGCAKDGVELGVAQVLLEVEDAEESRKDELECVQDTAETSSLLVCQQQEDTSNRDDGRHLSLSLSGEPCEDHPLRALSCASIACISEASVAPQPTIPDVYISVPNSQDGKVRFQKNICQQKEMRQNHGSECVPLSALFNSDSPGSQNHWGEEIGYKNWLMHLGRRRRCEILVLIGFLLWIGFFLVLAIVLNGNASKSTSDVVEDKDGHSKVAADRESNSTQDGMGFADFTSPTTIKLNEPINTIKLHETSTSSVAVKGSGGKFKASVSSDPGDGRTTNFPYTTSTTDNSAFQTLNASDKAPISPALEAKNLLSTASMASNFTSSPLAVSGKTPISPAIEANYLIGVGRADITGPAADVNMMGYANPNQLSGGIHLHQYARAFIIEDPKTNVRTVLVNIDACMSSTLLKLEVLKALKQEFGNLYTTENLCISGTHTHSAPAGFLQDVLFQISSWGFVDETLQAMVRGIVKSIKAAHESMRRGHILMNKGELIGSNINRSPTAYDNNPNEERAKYQYNVDTEMTVLKFVDENSTGIGMISWFPVHCTSMNNTNSLISSDNKGYAEILFERTMNPEALTGTGEFVAAFAQGNEGDVSPNTKGPHCLDTGEKCDYNHSTCDGKSQLCIASGPGKDMFESTQIIGRNQFQKAWELYNSATVRLEGPLDFVHEYIDMSDYEVTLNATTKAKTCKPAMGFSFAAGTTDGPGAFDFKQGDKTGNSFWQIVRNFLHPPSEKQKECHAPKPILLDTGEMSSPYEWQPVIVDTQILRIGQFYILALPGEFSTMAGRRLRDGVLETLKRLEPEIQHESVIAGLANAYSDYITTLEEYRVQRYEGASTIYGPHTARAYKQQYQRLAESLINGVRPKSSVQPPNNKAKLYSFLPGVIFDRAPFFKDFGDVLSDVKDSYCAGEVVSVKFVGANPRNALDMPLANVSFASIEKLMPNNMWKTLFTDADWETKFYWIRTSTVAGTSDVIVTWETDKETEPGKYRITHKGYYKYYLGGIYPYSGTSSVFFMKEKSD